MIIRKCASCGTNGANILYEGKFFCAKCTELFGTCKMCIHSRQCEFLTNPAPIPKIIAKRIRQETGHGYVEQIRESHNPQRIKAFCIEGNCICCKTCDDEKVRCLRQFGTCENYKEIEF